MSLSAAAGLWFEQPAECQAEQRNKEGKGLKGHLYR